MMFDALPTPLTFDGRPRGVGVELEFGGLTPRAAADSLVSAVGGEVVTESAHAFRVVGTAIGSVTVELDVRHAHPAKYGHELSLRLSERTADLFGRYAGWAIPTELVTAPLTPERLTSIDRIAAELRSLGARGTRDFGWRQFGLHFNPEVPSLAGESIASVLKAFLLLEGALRTSVLGGRNRYLPRMPPPFPPAYVAQVLSPDYWPSLPDLMREHLAQNATRQRSLDLLPLFLFVDEAQVRAALPWEKIRPRPVFHYRLPLSRIDQPGWSIGPDWNRWVAVERLASDRVRLDALCRDFLSGQGEGAEGAAIAAANV
ncbi:amidoligase family protein [Agaricicola taiwanensis]|nr:amidoligase family protein [Agaricicola taiwanensis]